MQAKRGLFLIFFTAVSVWVTGQETVTFAVRDSVELQMDVYVADQSIRQPETVVYVFGGGFFTGSRRDSVSVDYCRQMQERGFTTIAIDYRL